LVWCSCWRYLSPLPHDPGLWHNHICRLTTKGYNALLPTVIAGTPPPPPQDPT
jgi:hypothetical protein